MAIHIGTSGWSYDHWDGVLYPTGIKKSARLGVYTEHFHTVEVNSSFYHWPREATLANWRRSLPEGFRMTLKAPRALTHSKRLYQPEGWIERVARGMELLGERAGVLLVQLPPDFSHDYARLNYFLSVCPADLRMAFEFRHPDWHR